VEVTIFWDGDGWYFVAHSERVGPAERLREACVAAIGLGLVIGGVNGTRGTLPARNPGPAGSELGSQ